MNNIKINFFENYRKVNVTDNILEDLKIDQLLYIREINVLEYLTDDIQVLDKRNKLLYDISFIVGFYELLSYVVQQLLYISDMIKKQSIIDQSERSLYSIKQLETYFDIIDRMSNFYCEHKNDFTSEDFSQLFEKIFQISKSTEYDKLKKGVSKIMDEVASIKSISIGFNFDASLSPYEAGIISINKYYIESGNLIDRLLRLDLTSNYMSMAPIIPAKRQCKPDEFEMLELSIYSAINKIFKKQLRQWEPEINSYIAAKLNFLIEISPYLNFILKLAQIQNYMKEHGLKLCKPIFHPKEEKVFNAKNLYNPILALNLEDSGTPVIKNDFEFDENGMIYILQGPNNGGKSVFLTSICICQIFAQLGMLVPASSLELSPADGIFIHIQKYQTLNQNGKLADECVKISSMFSNMTEYSICFFDEAFSSTDASGALELSKNVLESLSYLKIRSVFNTHIHELTACADKINLENTGAKIDFITAQIISDERRTYRMERQRSENTSYAQSIARKLGITFESLTHKKNTIQKENEYNEK